MAYKIYNRRLIGFFDILGFSKKLEEYPLGELYELYEDLITKAKRSSFSPISHTPSGEVIQEQNFFYTQIVSDSIVLVSHEINIKNVNKFVLATVHLMELFFAHQFPLRGVIDIDDVLIDEEKNILLAKQLPKMVRTEKEMDWTGGIILKNCSSVIFEHVFLEKLLIGSGFEGDPNKTKPAAFLELKTINAGNPCVAYHGVPHKKEGTINQLCLNWVHGCTDEELKRGLEYLDDKKREHTVKFIEHVKSLPAAQIDLWQKSHPAVIARLMATRSQLRIITLDNKGSRVNPQECSIACF